MNKNTLIIGTVAIIIIVGFFFFTNKTDTPENESSIRDSQVTNQVPAPGFSGIVEEMIVVNEEENLTVVTYTNEGFSPKIVTISKGETVRFVNESSSSMWVASASHPTHKKYPAKSDRDCLGSSFDQCEMNQTGEVWEFTFTELGTHVYHNHTRASRIGTIIVE